MNALRNIVFALLLAIALGSGLSEPLCRNAARIIFFVTTVMLFTDQRVLNLVIRHKKILLSMAAFVGWIVISSFLAGQVPSMRDSSTYWIYFSYNMLLFIPIVLFIDRERKIDWILITLAISLFCNDFIIYGQMYYDVERPITFLRGSFMQSAILYVVLLPIYLVTALTARRRSTKIAWWTFFLVTLGASVLLKTRGAMLAMLITLPAAILFYVRDARRLIAIATVFVVSAGVLLTVAPKEIDRIQSIGNFDAEQSVSERFLMWRSAIEMIKDNPMTGVGFGKFEEKYQREYILPEAKERWQGHAHNTYLQLCAETGLIGLALYCAMFGCILRWAWRRRRNKYAAMALFSTIGFLLYSVTDYTYASYSAMRVYWFVFGLCVCGAELRRD